jgi:NADH:ubiquinone reductase (H+-translocating)
VLATGATHAYFGHDEWAPFAPGLKTLDDALRIRRRILLAFEQAEAAPAGPEGEAERQAWLHFAVVGGGPTGVELAGTLAEIARHTLTQEFRRIRPQDAKVVLLEAGPRVLASFPPSLSDKATVQLERLGVDVQCGTPVTAIDANGYVLGGGDAQARTVKAKTVLWAAGVAASPLGRLVAESAANGGDPGKLLDRAGRVKVNADLSVPGAPNVYVLGDLATVTSSGKPVPGVAPAAKQMGAHVAKVIAASLRGEPLGPAQASFTYKDYGNLATIGRMAAVVDLPGGLRFSGLLAWWFWLAAHVFFLIGFRNRLTVLLNWAWAYWTYERHARIVIGKEDAS